LKLFQPFLLQSAHIIPSGHREAAEEAIAEGWIDTGFELLHSRQQEINNEERWRAVERILEESILQGETCNRQTMMERLETLNIQLCDECLIGYNPVDLIDGLCSECKLEKK